MDYGSYQSLEELLRDGSATEFRAVVPEIPVRLSLQQLLDWPGPGWGGDYEAALAAFKRLAGAADDYDQAMAQVAALQQAAGDLSAGEDHETIATRIYSKAIDQLRADGVTLDDADLAGIWQHAWSEARSCTPEGEQEAASRAAGSVTIDDAGDEEIDGEELYRVIRAFIEDIGPVAGNAS